MFGVCGTCASENGVSDNVACGTGANEWCLVCVCGTCAGDLTMVYVGQVLVTRHDTAPAIIPVLSRHEIHDGVWCEWDRF